MVLEGKALCRFMEEHRALLTRDLSLLYPGHAPNGSHQFPALGSRVPTSGTGPGWAAGGGRGPRPGALRVGPAEEGEDPAALQRPRLDGGPLPRRVARAAPAEPLGNVPLLLYPGRAEPPFPGAFGVPDYPFEPALTQQRKERERRRVKRVSEGYARPRGHLPGARVVRGPLAALRVGGIQPLIGPVAARGVRGAVPLQGAAGGPQGHPRRGAALPAGATLPPSPSATAGRGPSSLGRVDGRGFEGPAGIGSPIRAARAPRPLRAAGGQPGTVIPGPAPAMRRLSTRWPQTPASSWGAWGPPPQPHPARSPEGLQASVDSATTGRWR
ncbi:achaete-scute homolog 5 [Manis javanica]|uniref:achaete-scute homolog 5 n=1 Tax=Manis javanica TaxID=9974 RepID=UPI003C6CD304